MKFIKKHWLRLLVWPFMVALVLICLILMKNAERDAMERLNPHLRTIRLREKEHEAFHAAERKRLAKLIREGKVNTNLPSKQIWGSKPASQFSPEERKALEELFAKHFKPAIEHWANAYSNRIPFEVSEVTMDKFHSTLGSHMFTFMIGDTTLTFMLDKDGGNPRVGYMMVRQAAVAMNQLPAPGTQSNLSVPVTSAQVLDMIRADTGTTYKPNEIIMRPTGKASAMNGGVFVDILPAGADQNNFMNYKLCMTFDSNGRLVDYERDPNL